MKVEVMPSGEDLAKQSTEKAKKGPSGKTDPAYWKPRLHRPAFTRDGVRRESPVWAIRLMHKGRREAFNLGTNDRGEAARKARDRFVFLEANGWGPTLAKYKPRATPKVAVPTVGQVIAEAERVALVSRRTFATYAQSLRAIAAGVADVVPPVRLMVVRRRTDGKQGNPVTAGAPVEVIERKVPASGSYRTAEFKKWRSAVDAVPITKLTAEAVGRWRASKINAALDPLARERAKITADSVIRSAKAVFGKRILPSLRATLTIPDPLPLAGIPVGKSSRRFKPEVDARLLFAVAKAELADKHPEQFKALALALLAGLRKAEIDCLTWKQVDLEAGEIRIETTEHFRPKSTESARTVPLSPAAIEIVRTFKSGAENDPTFVLRGAAKARPNERYEVYRADVSPHRTWTKLAAWLRTKGIRSEKPTHSLRKLAGSLIHETHGIEAARDFLGHADIATTAGSYLAPRRATVDLAEEKPSPFAGQKSEPKEA